VDSVFDINKTVAAAAFVIKRCGGTITAFLLMKMLYAAERAALASWHRPITGDSFSSMKNGPILSRTLDLINGKVLSTNSDMVKWSQHFSPRIGNDIKLVSEPDFDFLSQREVEVLEKAAREIAELIKQHGLIADFLHQAWPEWKDPKQFGKGSIPLPIEDVLSEVIEDENEAEKVLLEIRSVSSAKAALQTA